MNALVAENLSKRFEDKVALNNFSLTIPKGSVYGLLGPNGAGKTTFLRIVNQITAPDTGHVLLNDVPLSPEQISQVGYMPEERGLYKNMKVGEQAIYFAKLKGLSEREAKQKAKAWFEKLEIDTWWDKKLTELSKGMGQKVQFVITVIHEPSLLIFDEPFSGFDPVNATRIAQEILELRDKGTTIIFSTHRMESVEEMCDNIALINKSEKVLDGKLSEVKNNFKNGEYKVEIQSENDLAPQTQLQLQQYTKTGNTHSFMVKAEDKENPNQLVQHLMQLGQINRFEENIPSLNEIFIKAVQS